VEFLARNDGGEFIHEVAYRKKNSFGSMRRLGDASVGLRKFQSQYDYSDGDADGDDGACRPGAELYSDGRRNDDADGELDLPVCVHAVADDRGSKSDSNQESNQLHFGADR